MPDPAQVFRGRITGIAARDDWQADAWDMVDQVGELRYYVTWRASSCSRVRLVASDIDPDTGLPTGSTDNLRFQEIVRAIAGGPLGQAQLIKRTAECLTVPGEVWVTIIITPDGERWLALTKEEIRRGSRGVEIELPDGTMHPYSPGADSLFRMWNSRPRRATEADSPVRACLPCLHEIVYTTQTIAKASKSRLLNNGLLLLPEEINLPPVNSPVAAGQVGPGQLTLDSTPAVQQIMDMLMELATKVYDDPEAIEGAMPIMATVSGEQVKNVSHLTWDTQLTDVSIKIRNDGIARLAMGLDVSPERLLGLGAQSNHWSAWQIGDEDVQLHIVPVMETICHGIYTEVLTPILVREGLDPARFMLWYDASNLTADPDKTENANTAFGLGTINAEAHRDYLGLDADAGYDYSTLEGWQQWAQDHLSAHPELMPILGPLALGSVADQIPEIIAELVPQPAQPAIEAAPPEQQQGPPQTENQPVPSQSTPAARQRHDEHFIAWLDTLAGRALDMAGKRRRNRTNYERLRDVEPRDVHRYLPPVAPAEVGRLIEGWDVGVEDEVLARIGIDAEELRTAVRQAVREQLTRPMVDV